MLHCWICFKDSSCSGLCVFICFVKTKNKKQQKSGKSLPIVILVANEGPQSPFHHILPKCKLARDLKEAYDR